MCFRLHHSFIPFHSLAHMFYLHSFRCTCFHHRTSFFLSHSHTSFDPVHFESSVGRCIKQMLVHKNWNKNNNKEAGKRVIKIIAACTFAHFSYSLLLFAFKKTHVIYKLQPLLTPPPPSSSFRHHVCICKKMHLNYTRRISFCVNLQIILKKCIKSSIKIIKFKKLLLSKAHHFKQTNRKGKKIHFNVFFFAFIWRKLTRRLFIYFMGNGKL